MLSKINGNVEDNIVAMEQVLHEVSSKSIPNYSSEIRQKPTGKSIWNRGIAKAARNARKSHRIWKEGGTPKDRTDPLKVQKITAKRLLRKAQRQAYASSRNSWARKIMDASTTDTKLFHTLINKQRGGKSQNTKTLIMEHKIADNTDDILNMWKEHFETLSIKILTMKSTTSVQSKMI